MVLLELAFIGGGVLGIGKIAKDTVKGAIIESECGGGIENPSKYSIENKKKHLKKEEKQSILAKKYHTIKMAILPN